MALSDIATLHKVLVVTYLAKEMLQELIPT